MEFSAEFCGSMKLAGIKMTHLKAKRFVLAFAEALSEGLSKDRELTLSNLGTFLVKKVGARIILNPQGDGRKFFMPPTNIVKWIPSGKIRVRAETAEISEDEWQKLVGHGSFEDDEEKVAKSDAVIKNPPPDFDTVTINVTPPEKFIFDEFSPISKFVKKILNQAKEVGANKIEFRPENSFACIRYLANNKEKQKHKIIKDSHLIIITKIKKIAKKDFEFSSKLSPFGEILTLEFKKYL
ncbi:MAG: hypothetical protein Athens101428_418 [Candidatus Berkelbacteria bacterium Athens1014_28]|uniref:Uncharacterized protein n=1 Tax=Candidatus Berkelbacteria bacterium Athens1014_28 TaxID=2017145 RepID=A0A554LMJ2_9BACT|nr:MAG: hypothetical protein Athens101428_418 [Candidatus Berkelbacteria bacterium Athens1014_28]